MRKIGLLLILVWIGTLVGYQPTAAQTTPLEGRIIFGAWWDSNRDGAVTPDTDIRSLFQLTAAPDGSVRPTPITQREAAVPLVRPDGSVPFYLDRSNLLQTPSRTVSREPVLDSAYTPDGARLAILTQPPGLPNRNVSLVDVRTGVLTQFTGANIDDTSLSLSPDGSRILFTQSIFGVNRLYVLDIRTGAVIPITDGSYRVSSPRWNPNASAIAYVRTVDNNRNGYDGGDPRTLWLTDPNGINQRQISPPDAVDAGAPIWSPNGIHIAFAHRNDNDANRRITPADALQLAVADVGTGITNAVAAGIAFQTVLWNPNGTRLAFRGTTTDTNGDGFLSDADNPTLWVMHATDVVATFLTTREQVV
ncbi:MAG: PD40 domain-containing protein, partial [Anaerolineae bacterium]|nr:PD40 domain-containing protein [Anaerolineae bacterium]